MDNKRLIEKAQHFTTGQLSASLLVSHDTISGGHDNVAETTSRKDVLHPLLDAIDGDIKRGRDNTALIQSAHKGDDDLTGTVVVKNLELTNVTCK